MARHAIRSGRPYSQGYFYPASTKVAGGVIDYVCTYHGNDRFEYFLLLSLAGLIGNAQAASTASVRFVQVAATTPQLPVDNG